MLLVLLQRAAAAGARCKGNVVGGFPAAAARWGVRSIVKVMIKCLMPNSFLGIRKIVKERQLRRR